MLTWYLSTVPSPLAAVYSVIFFRVRIFRTLRLALLRPFAVRFFMMAMRAFCTLAFGSGKSGAHQRQEEGDGKD